MTILTFWSFGGKLVKVSLISDEFHHGQTQPPPPYQPKLLETGDGGLPNAENNNNGKSDISIWDSECMQQFSYLFNKTLDIVIAIGILGTGVYMLTLIIICEYKLSKYRSQVIQQEQQDTEDSSTMVWRNWACYPSYAFAETDWLLLPYSPPPSSKNMDINPVEGVIRKAPQITIKSNHKSVRFLLVIDSSVNITGIVDFESQRCYVMQLLHNSFEPHKSLCDTLNSLPPEYYSLDNINKILSYFHMVEPAIINLHDYGMYISKHCTDYPTFKMERDVATDSPKEVY